MKNLKPLKATNKFNFSVDYFKDLIVRTLASLTIWLLLIAFMVCVAYGLKTIALFLSYWFNINLF